MQLQVPRSLITCFLLIGSTKRSHGTRPVFFESSPFTQKRTPLKSFPDRFIEFISSQKLGDSNFTVARYTETLQQIVGDSLVHLSYNATISSSTQVLDDIDEVENISCFDDRVEIRLSAGSDYSKQMSLFHRLQKNKTIIHGGPEWGCINNYTKEAAPFYFQVSKSHMSNETMVLSGTPCSPFLAFQNLSWRLWSEPMFSDSEPTPNETADLRQIQNRKSRPKTSRAKESARDLIADDVWSPAPLSSSIDLLDDLCSSNSWDCTNRSGSFATAYASYSFSPIVFYWNIDLSVDDSIPFIHISQNVMWIQQTQSIDLSSSVHFQPNFALTASGRIPKIKPMKINSLLFKIGIVTVSATFSAQLDYEVIVDIPSGFSLNAQYTSTKTIRTGFEWDGSSFTPINNNTGWIPEEAHECQTPLSADLELHLLPQLTFGLDVAITVIDIGMQLQVNFITQLQFFKKH